MFLNVKNNLDTRNSATGAAVVTPDDNGDLRRGPENVATCTLWVQGVGPADAIRVLTADGDDVTFELGTLTDYQIHIPVQVQRVFATGTTFPGAPGQIIALY